MYMWLVIIIHLIDMVYLWFWEMDNCYAFLAVSFELD